VGGSCDAWAKAGLISGVTHRRFRPSGNATAAQVAMILIAL
jgi:hypothetical protein